MVKCLRAFLNFCYIARRSAHDSRSLIELEAELASYHDFRQVFIDKGVRKNFALPRQHALVHYVNSIRLFGSPNGLCSSITESKHIKAVKEPWRRSSRKNPLLEILQTVSRLNKITAARSVFGSRRLLNFDVLSDAKRRASGMAQFFQFFVNLTHDRHFRKLTPANSIRSKRSCRRR
jgi:hypothetical protein